MLELDKVNFKEARASKELRNCEVARLDGVTFPSEWEDVMSSPPTVELKGQPKLAFIHTRTVCVWCAANEHSIKEQCCTNIMDHRQLATYTMVIVQP